MTDFFKQLSSKIGKADVSMTFRMSGEQMTVMVTVKNTSKDEVLDTIKPIVISGTAEELDNEFFLAINNSLTKATGIITNAVDYETELSEKEKQTASAKAKEEADKKAKDEKAKAEQKEKEKREKKYNELIEKAEQFEKDKNSKMAFITYKKAIQFTDTPEEIQKKMNSIVAAQGSIFDQSNFTEEISSEVNQTTEEVEEGVSE